MIKVANLARIITSLLLIIVLGFVYANLPEMVGLHFNDEAKPDYMIEKSYFFYFTILIFLAFNLLNTIFVKVFEQIPISSTRMFFTNARFKSDFTSWISSFSPVINLFLIFVISFIGIYNSGDVALINSYSYLAYFGQFLVLAWLVMLIFILLNRNK